MSRNLALAAGLAVTIGVSGAGGASAGCKPERPDVTEARRELARARVEQARTAVFESDHEHDSAAEPMGGLDAETAALVVATIGQRSITLGELAEHIARQPRAMRARFATAEQRERLLRDMVDFEVLAGEAARLGLDRKPTVQLALKQALVRELLSRSDAAGAAVSELDESQMRAWYAAHHDRFNKPERRRAAMLVTATPDEAPAVAEQLREALSHSPRLVRQVFGDFVVAKSADEATKALKGDLGWLVLGAEPPTVGQGVVQAVFGLDKIGEVAGPLPLPDGRQALVQLTHREPAVAQSFDQARPAVQSALIEELQASARTEYVAQLRSAADVHIDSGVLARLDASRSPDGATPSASPDAPAEGTTAPPTKVRLNPAVLRRAFPGRTPGREREVPLKTDPELRRKAGEILERMHKGGREDEEGSQTEERRP